MDCFETSVRNYHSTLYKPLEQRKLTSSIFQGQEVQEKFFMDFLTLEDRTGRLSRNVGTKLPFYTVQNPRRAQISFTSWRNPEVTHSFMLFESQNKRQLFRVKALAFGLERRCVFFMRRRLNF